MSYERQNIREMTGYTSGEQPESANTVKLNTNENPYPPSPRVVDALHNFDVNVLRQYPPATARALRETIARVHGVDPDQVIATRGGDELLRLAITTFADPGQPIGVADPSYSLYEVLAAIQNCPLHAIPLGPDYALAQDFAARLNAAACPLAFVVNPHAPSGRLCSARAIEAICSEFNGVLLVDEAYVDFVEPDLGHDVLHLINTLPNLLVLRTLSKGYSLAGLRLGYGIGPRALVAPMMNKTRDSYNVDGITQALAIAAISDQAHAANSWRQVRVSRARLAADLGTMGLVAPPSETNFLLVKVPESWPVNAAQVHAALKQGGVLVRHFAVEGLNDRLRITVGTAEENEQLVSLLRVIAGANEVEQT